jgi:hypothetical protein
LWYVTSPLAALGPDSGPLFQVQVAPESHPAVTQQFQLKQQVQMGKMEVGLVFDGGSNPTVVTKEYAERRRLKKISTGIPVIGFRESSPDVEIGNLYKVPLKASDKRQIPVCAMAVSAIYNRPSHLH